MSEFDDLISEIKTVQQLSVVEGSGFYAVYCPVCDSRKKKTGGWRFEGNTIVYNCFRGSCDSSCVFEEGEPISKKFKNLMRSIGVQIPVSLLATRNNIQKKFQTLNKELFEKHEYQSMDRPKYYLPLKEAKEIYEQADVFDEYFQSRCCSIDDVYFILDGDYTGLAAIEMRLRQQIIGYSIVTLSGNGKYLNYSVNDNLIYTPDGRVHNTVILVEGRLDAKVFPQTISIGGSKISKKQAYFLQGKRVIMLPDRSNNNFIKQFSGYGWEITIPDWNVNDLAAAVVKYGTMVTAKKIMDGVCKTELEASVRYNSWRIE